MLFHSLYKLKVWVDVFVLRDQWYYLSRKNYIHMSSLKAESALAQKIVWTKLQHTPVSLQEKFFNARVSYMYKEFLFCYVILCTFDKSLKLGKLHDIFCTRLWLFLVLISECCTRSTVKLYARAYIMKGF